jgi:hypothetical protein
LYDPSHPTDKSLSADNLWKMSQWIEANSGEMFWERVGGRREVK